MDPLDLLAGAASAMAGTVETDDVLQTVVDVAARTTGARYAALGVLGDDGTITRFVTHGASDDVIRAIGHYPTGKGLLGLLIREPEIVRVADLRDHPASAGFPPHHPPMTAFLGGPVRSGGRVFGNLYLTEKAGGFTEDDERLLAVLAAQAGAAVENAQLSARLRQLAVSEERERISRELHDSVIQTLYSVGMGLQAARALATSDPAAVAARIDGAVDALDQTIRDLRSAIFELRPADAASLGLSAGLAELAREYEVNALIRPSLVVPADLDARVPAALAPDVLAIVREALSNAAKHAMPSRLDVIAAVDGDTLEIEVADDGVGFEPGTPAVGRGLGNVAERAEALGAELSIDTGPGEGTTVHVRVPLPREEAP